LIVSRWLAGFGLIRFPSSFIIFHAQLATTLPTFLFYSPHLRQMQFVIINLRQFRQRQRARRSRGGGTITTDAAKLHKSLPTSGREKKKELLHFSIYFQVDSLSRCTELFPFLFDFVIVLALRWQGIGFPATHETWPFHRLMVI